MEGLTREDVLALRLDVAELRREMAELRRELAAKDKMPICSEDPDASLHSGEDAVGTEQIVTEWLEGEEAWKNMQR